ncbi:MAG TPA: chemotaxis protein MotB, partial [Bacteroidetes bacterium]|nr:chemotaxis protein MotB [Bacteroidota bacterium]
MKKKHGHEEPENHERWLLTYADLITLLLGLFVILYAMSKVDAAKYAEVAAALGGVFGGGGKVSVAQGSSGILQLPMPVVPKERQEVQKQVEEGLGGDLKSGRITLSTDERGLTLHVAEELSFSSGSAEPKQEMLRVLDTVAAIIRRLPHDIRVEGHTDDIPINTVAYRSNWHLSVARAVNIAYYFIESKDFSPEKVSVAGYGEFRPLVPNTSDMNRAKNRRVDIVILNNVE